MIAALRSLLALLLLLSSLQLFAQKTDEVKLVEKQVMTVC